MAGNFSDWGIKMYDNKPVRVCLFVSRNKDNKDVKGFKERRVAFLTTKSYNDARLNDDFIDFVNKGVEGEMSRMYVSVNARDTKKIYKELLHFLFDNPDFNLTHIQGKLAGIGAKKENALEHKWLFDFDSTNLKSEIDFVSDILNYVDCNDIYSYPTPHGFAIVVDHGFDTRELMKRWEDTVTLKRDDLLCVNWACKINFK